MNIEIRTDKNIQNSERLISYVRDELNQEFQRYSEKITSISVHFSDENGPKGGEDDIQCMLEVHPAGLKSVVVRHRGHNIDTAIHGAIDRIKRGLEHSFEKNEPQRGVQHEFVDADE